MKSLQAFRAHFKRLSSRFAQLNGRSKSLVVEEPWASDEMFDFRPFSKELSFRSGKWLKLKPSTPYYKRFYRFDAQKRPVISTMELKDEYNLLLRETYFVYDKDATISACFEHRQNRRNKSDYEIKLVDLERLALKNGKPIMHERLTELGGDSYLRFEYFYDKHRITSVKTADDSEGELQFAKWRIVYDPDGQVNRIDLAGGQKCPAIRWPYRRNSKPLNLKQLTKQLELKLATLVVDAVRQAKVREPVYSLVLGYSSEGELALPPYLGLGTERERAGWCKSEHVSMLKEVLWNPEEYKNQPSKNVSLLLDDPDLQHLCNYYLELHGSKDALKPSIGLLRATAKQLMRYNWSSILDPTDDFVVLAYDVEDSRQTRANLTASVPSRLAKKFSKWEWV